MDPSETKRVENANPILQVAIELGVKVRGTMGACFRSERHPDAGESTLFFDVAKNRFFCKTCADVGGGVTDLVCQLRGWEREQALEWLAHRLDFDQHTRNLYYKGRSRAR